MSMSAGPASGQGGGLGGVATPAALLREAVLADPSRPLLTFYDDTQGGARVELSVATFDNWVAKTANLLTDGLAAQPGERVALLLPPHWLTAVWLMACWSAGLVAQPVPEVSERTDAAGADVAVAGPERLRAALDLGAEVVAVSLHPLGIAQPGAGGPGSAVGGDTVAGDTVDFATEVLGYGDRYVPYQPVGAAQPALQVDGRRLTGAQLVAAAREAAERWGLGPGDRVLSTVSYDTLAGVLVSLLGPLAAGASVVLCRGHPAGAGSVPASADGPVGDLVRRVTAERVTAAGGVYANDLPVRRLPVSSGNT